MALSFPFDRSPCLFLFAPLSLLPLVCPNPLTLAFEEHWWRKLQMGSAKKAHALGITMEEAVNRLVHEARR